ncbi:MAG: putative transporter [Tepidisphaeraceae bacterium]|jgi:putative transport protein
MHITNSLETLIEKGSIAWGLATLSLAVVLGLALGAVRVHGIRLGVSGVLFSALVFGQLGLTVNPQVLEFLRDFALIIFVYSVGLQVGPGFAASLREEGMRLNVLSILVVGLGALMTAGITKAVHLPPESATGLYSGAYTTTPGLGAGQDALAHLLADDPEKMHAAVARAGLAYTITYPFGILGPILMIVTLRKIFRIRMADEMSDLAVAEQVRRPPIAVVDLEVTNPAQAGIPLKSHPLLQASEVYFSRMLRNGVMSVPTGDTEIRVGDFYRAMGTKSAVAEIVAALGRPSTPDFNSASGDVQRTDFIVTRTDVLRRPLRDLDLIRRAGVAIGRVNRAGVDLFPRASMRLQFGDRVTAIGSEAGLKIVEGLLGNSPDRLNRPQLIPIFLGIVLGVLVGSIPIWIPGLHERVRIGLAGGPMLAAIVLSQLGNIGSVVWYMPVAANQLFRDFGLAVFLACVGLQSGDHFLQRVNEGGGIMFIVWGALITMIPVFLVSLVARIHYKMNFITLCGWLAGAMTSSPALLFANDIAGSEAPSVAYAAVAPLALLTPIICAQLLVVLM